MSSGLNWLKAKADKAKRDGRLSSIKEEAEYRGKDAAARFLAKIESAGRVSKGKRKAKKPTAKATANTRIHIYTDGACEPNPGAGGWAFVVIEGGVETNNRNGGDIQSTNNAMELTAVLAALEYAKASGLPADDTTIYSDSQYCVKGCNEWRHGWARKGWTRNGDTLANAGLWQAIAAAHDAFRCQIVWVRGHSGVPGNERADRLAAKGRAYAIEHRITAADEDAA